MIIGHLRTKYWTSESGQQRVDCLLCLFWSVKDTILPLFSSSAKDGIWSQVGGSGRSNHSIVIWENDGDVVVLEDRGGLNAPEQEFYFISSIS